MAEAARVPGKAWYVLAAAIVLAGTLAAGALIAWAVISWDEGTQFLAPGRRVLDLRAGRHVVWNDYRTIFGGRSYNEPKHLPTGVVITVTGQENGRPVAVRGAGNSTFTGENVERAAVVEFDVAQPGSYEIAVRGDFPQRVFSVGPELARVLLVTMFGTAALLFLSWGVGGAIAAWAYLVRDQAQAPVARGTGAAAAPAGAREKSLKQLAAIVYGLQIASILVGITLFAAVIINYVSRRDVEGTWLESHFRWQIRTFWYTLLWTCVGLALLIVLVGFFVLMAAAMWLLYRSIKGWIDLEEGRTMDGTPVTK